jgi:hypothetical protein
MATIYMVQANRWAQEHSVPLDPRVIKAIQQVNEAIVFPGGNDPTTSGRGTSQTSATAESADKRDANKRDKS